MRSAFPLFVLLCLAIGAAAGCGRDPNPYPQPPTGFDPIIAESTPSPEAMPATDSDPNGPSLEMMITKSMLYDAGLRHGVNPYLVMGLAWHESGWQASVVSSAGAVGIMQVMPATAEVDGPVLLHRSVNLYDPGDNIDLGTAILKNNLDHWRNDLAKALCAYYAGGAAVTDWSSMRTDCKRYVWAVYNAAVMFKEGKGPA
ncbi:MAG TPA: lytic transglycosylase domain-containing protein [Candidatus Dormibacteraeota bacterium]|nr:lytic transglycosylase domain-containing protein [Candidatus Dormibacteraeota bacterium]